MNDSNPTLRKAMRLLKRIAKKLGNKNLRIVVQISSDSDHDENSVTYTAMIASPQEGVQPITFAAFTKEDFLAKIKNFLDNKSSQSDLEIVFYEAKIISAKQAIEFSEAQIEKIKNPEVEEAEIVTSDDGENNSEPGAVASDETK